MIASGIDGANNPITRMLIMEDGTLRIGSALNLADSSTNNVTITPTGNLTIAGKGVSASTTDSDGDNTLVTKAYMLTKFGAAGNGTVTSVGAGDGLETSNANNADITGAGSLSVKAADSTIQVTADGIRVVTDQLPSSPVTSVNGNIGAVVLDASDVDALALAGGTMTGVITFSNAQTFPGTVTDINGSTPDSNGEITLSATDVGAVPASGGSFTGGINVDGNVVIPTTSTGVFTGDGSGLTDLNVPQSVTFRGTTKVANDDAPSAVAGDFYLNTAAGVAGSSWTGIVDEAVLNDQFVFYTASSVWVKGGITDASTFVTLASTQTISGNKTFSSVGTFTDGLNVTGALSATTLAGDGSQITGIDFPVDSVNGETGAVVISTTSLGALPLTGGTMTGDIVFNTGQTFAGTVTSVNSSVTPDGSGNIVLGASNVDAVSKTTGGAFDAEVTGVTTTGSSNSKSIYHKRLCGCSDCCSCRWRNWRCREHHCWQWFDWWHY